jgi:hypothetical protein
VSTQSLTVGGLISEVRATGEGDDVVGGVSVLGWSPAAGADGMLGENLGAPEQVFAAGVTALEGLGARAPAPAFPPRVKRTWLGVWALEDGAAGARSSRHQSSTLRGLPPQLRISSFSFLSWRS